MKKYRVDNERQYDSGRFTYRLRQGGAVLTAYSGSRAELIVPERLDNLPVIGVEGAFCAAHMRHIVLPETLRFIGSKSFSLCQYLKALVVPAGVTEIARDAFENSPPVTLYVTPSSAAHRWAQTAGMPFAFGKPEIAPGAGDFIAGDFTCALMNDGGLTIREYNGRAETLEIPSEIGGVPVTRLGVMSFAQHPTLREVIVPEGVRTVDGGAFVRCRALRRVTLPDSVTEMGPAVFQQSEVEEVRLPGALRELPNATFYDAGRLKQVALPDSIRRIGASAFFGCFELERLTLPAGLEAIGNSAFNSSGLLELELPEGLQVIGDFAFFNCPALTLRSLPESLTSLGEYAISDCRCLWTEEDDGETQIDEASLGLDMVDDLWEFLDEPVEMAGEESTPPEKRPAKRQPPAAGADNLSKLLGRDWRKPKDDGNAEDDHE